MSFRFISLVAASFLGINLTAGELLIDFVPNAPGMSAEGKKVAGKFYSETPELKLTISFDQQGVPSYNTNENGVPMTVFGNCPEVASRSIHITLKAIGSVDPITGLDTGTSPATEFVSRSAGLGVESPTDPKSAQRSAVCNQAGLSEAILVEFDLASVPSTVRLTVTEISLSGFTDANDALTLVKIGGIPFDYLPQSSEAIEAIDVGNANLTLRGDPRPTALFSIFSSGVGSNFRLTNFRLEFEKLTPGQ